jgi:hypothetical protein
MSWNGFFDLHCVQDIETLKQLFRDALAVSTFSHVDVLTGARRERYPDCTPEEYIEKYITMSTHNVFIDRSAYSSLRNEGEVGSCTMDSLDLYLFIYLDVDKLYELVEKYGLKKRFI